MYKDVHLWRGGSAITSTPLVLRSSNFCSAAEKRYADITEKAHFYGAVPIILRPCKMMGASFAFRKTSHSIFLSAPSMAQVFNRGDFPRQITT